jgi:hypothetical protein
MSFIIFIFSPSLQALEQLILEARERSIATLGETLFLRIYKLCSDFMTVTESLSAEDELSGDKKLSKTAVAANKNAKLLKVR